MGLNADFTAPPPSHTLLAVQAAPSHPRGGVTHLTRLLQNYLMFQCQDCLHKCLLTRRAGFHGLVPGALLAGADSRREPFCCGLFEQDLPLPGPPPTALGLRPGASRG